MKCVLEVDSVQKSFGFKSIISDAYLKCETGNIIGLLGRNGSGKSTLLKIIFGIVPADFKFIGIDGQVISRPRILMDKFSYLHQENFIPAHFKVSKAISLSIAAAQIPLFYQDPMITRIKNSTVSQLSGGELRYLEIKLVLSNNSKFALLDEPYNGLSPIAAMELSRLIKQHAAHKGIIITDHNYRNVLDIATSVILMEGGKTHHLSNVEELIAKGYLREGML